MPINLNYNLISLDRSSTFSQLNDHGLILYPGFPTVQITNYSGLRRHHDLSIWDSERPKRHYWRIV